MNCFIYCRKSTEDQSRQIQSIGDQKKILSEIAKLKKLKVIEIFTDEKSAGKPYQRTAFQEMMQRISAGEASIILSWKIDRLSRNPIENGQISWMLQKGIIQEIITPERTYLPEDNVMLFMIESAMANQYLRDLSTNVKRGMNSSVEKGVYPACAPIGYLNEGKLKGNKQIIPDPIQFDRLQTLWNLIIKENYQLAELYRIMLKKHPLIKRGKPISFSSFHKIFRNQFYCGLFKWNGQLHKGSHKPMITQSDFQKVQKILITKDNNRTGKLEFDFRGIFKCGTCNSCITSERKTKLIKSENKQKDFDYYKCSHKKRAFKCKEKPLSHKKIEIQLFHKVQQFGLPQEVLRYGLKDLSNDDTKDMHTNQTRIREIDRTVQTLNQQQKTIESNITTEPDPEIRQLMKQKLTETKIELQKLQEDKKMLISEQLNWNKELKDQLQIISKAEKVLNGNDKNMKQELLKNLGSNWHIKNKEVHYKPHFVCNAIKTMRKRYPRQMGSIEPSGTQAITGERLSTEHVSLLWWGIWKLIKNHKKIFDVLIV